MTAVLDCWWCDVDVGGGVMAGNVGGGEVGVGEGRCWRWCVGGGVGGVVDVGCGGVDASVGGGVVELLVVSWWSRWR